ncbi:diphthamide biosynthesis enzyme Dph2 [Geoglobus acetivorans]|nr:diphthamide biosynthesis enzyme Dph2 [Geoglobus acetivorans]
MGSESLTIFDKINFPNIFEKIGNARTVGLQLPDGLKYYVKEISEEFEKRGFETIISGKASYGACDLDTELLKHVDVLVHFGHSRFVDTPNVIYVPYTVNYEINPEKIKKHIPERNIAIIGTLTYAWKFKEVKKILEDAGFQVELKSGRGVEFEGQVLGCNYSCLRESKSDAVLFIGDGMFHATGAGIYSGKKTYAYHPHSDEVIEVETEDFIKKRYILISKAKMSESFGILVSSKPGQFRLNLAKRLKREASRHGLKAEIIVADEITPEIVENFRFDCYVNTACPRIAYDDTRRFGKPIISPQEFEISIGLKDEYVFDFI